MNILIPMAGAGSRFQKVGYKISKPAIPTYDKRTGKLLPMVVCACLDLPSLEENGANVIFVERTFHRENGTEKEIKKFFSQAKFLTVDQLTEGQACTCLLAKNLIDNDEELLIAGCDNGMEFDEKNLMSFARVTWICWCLRIVTMNAFWIIPMRTAGWWSMRKTILLTFR